ncbi:MAG: hypothetical protein ACYTG5_12530 [Planctomycetota bacterium]|jgi:hypothetical protein
MPDFENQVPEQELLSDLQQAWSDLGETAPCRELQAEDAETQRCVEWLRKAYQSQTAPTLKARRVRRQRIPMRLAAAAILLLGAALVITINPFGSASPEGDEGRNRSTLNPRLIRTTAASSELLAGRVRLTLINPEEDESKPERREE